MATNGRKWQQPQSFQRIPKRRLSDMKKLDMFATRFNLLAKSVAQMGAVVLILTGESEVIWKKNRWRSLESKLESKKWHEITQLVSMRTSSCCASTASAKSATTSAKGACSDLRLMGRSSKKFNGHISRLISLHCLVAAQSHEVSVHRCHPAINAKKLINTIKRISQEKWQANGGDPKGNRR